MVGIFFYFFIGIGSALVAGATGVLYVILAHGVALAIAISALGHVSGGHFTPAITPAITPVGVSICTTSGSACSNQI